MEKNNIEILKIIRKIRDRHYEILKDKSYEEIADLLRIPIGTVKARIFRAREAIDEKLRPLIEGN